MQHSKSAPHRRISRKRYAQHNDEQLLIAPPERVSEQMPTAVTLQSVMGNKAVSRMAQQERLSPLLAMSSPHIQRQLVRQSVGGGKVQRQFDFSTLQDPVGQIGYLPIRFRELTSFNTTTHTFYLTTFQGIREYAQRGFSMVNIPGFAQIFPALDTFNQQIEALAKGAEAKRYLRAYHRYTSIEENHARLGDIIVESRFKLRQRLAFNKRNSIENDRERLKQVAQKRQDEMKQAILPKLRVIVSELQAVVKAAIRALYLRVLSNPPQKDASKTDARVRQDIVRLNGGDYQLLTPSEVEDLAQVVTQIAPSLNDKDAREFRKNPVSQRSREEVLKGM